MARFVRLVCSVALWLPSVAAAVDAEANGTYPAFDYTVTLTPGQRVHFDGSVVDPGAVIGLEGEGAQLVLHGLRGTADQPIVIVNRAGRVRIGSAEGDALRLSACSHVELRGDGDPEVRHGIELFQAGDQGLHITDLSTDVAASWLENHHAGFAGVMAKTDPTWHSEPGGSGTPGAANRGKFVQRKTRIHHMLIYDCPGEGMYVGHSFFSGIHADRHDSRTPLLYPHELHGVSIAHNQVFRCGREGIQVGSATHDVEIHHNLVYDCGLLGLAAQSNGIQLGEGTTGRLSANTIVRTRANGVILLGRGDIRVEDNVIVDAGENAIFADSRPDTRVGSTYMFSRNTLVRPARHGLLVFDSHRKAMHSTFTENLVVLTPGGSAVERHDHEERFMGAHVTVHGNTVVTLP